MSEVAEPDSDVSDDPVKKEEGADLPPVLSKELTVQDFENKKYLLNVKEKYAVNSKFSD